MKKLFVGIRMFLWMTILTGIVYPLLVTAIAQLTMKQKADGGFIYADGELLGAALISQKFESDKYFWSRPSAVDYNPLPSGGSNLGPTSIKLQRAVEERRDRILHAHKVESDKIPAELLFSSASGLDPHISVSTAYFQVERVAKARGLNQKVIVDLIDQMTLQKDLGFLGETRINVLLLNIALDKVYTKGKN